QPENTVLLAGGVPAAIDTSMTSDVLQSQIEALGTACVFVEFHHIGDDIVVTVDDAVFGLLGPAADFELLVQLLAQTSVSARAHGAEGLVGVDVPADPQPLSAPNVPKLNADVAAPIFPSSLPAAGERPDEGLSLDPTGYPEPPHGTKGKTPRSL